MSDNSDILICAEFRQIVGPSILFTVPQQPRIQGKGLRETEDILNALTLKALSMKFTFDEGARPEAESPYNDDSYIVMEFDELRRYTCLWYFTYLPDLSARGFARRIGLAYLCPFKEKLMRHMDCLSYAFQQALLCLKYPLCAVYRYEAVQYAAILDDSIGRILAKIPTIEQEDEVKASLQKLTSDYTKEGLEKLVQQLLDLKFFLLNRHSLLHMKHVPLFYQLFQTEEVTDLITFQEFASIQLDFAFLKREKKLRPQAPLIPENFPSQIIAIPPHELRIQKRQELRGLELLATTGFFNYFRTVLQLIFNYFSQSIADLEFAEIMTQFNTQQLVQNKKLKGIWFGQKFFLPCELDEAFALSYTFQPYKRYRDLYIPIEALRLKEVIEDEQNYAVLDGGQDQPVLSINLPYQQVSDRFYIAYHSMFPYIPSIAPQPASLTQAMPSYGHLLLYVQKSFPERVVKSMISQLLAGYQVVCFTDERSFAIILQQAMDPFLIGMAFQQARSVVDAFTPGLGVKHVQQQLSIFYYTGKAEAEAVEQFQKTLQTTKPDIQTYDFAFSAKQLSASFVQTTSTIAEDLLLEKETPTIFCVSRRLECCFRKLALESLYNQKVGRIYKTGEDARIVQRIQQIVAGVESLDFAPASGKKKAERFKLEPFQDALNRVGLNVMILAEADQPATQPGTAIITGAKQ